LNSVIGMLGISAGLLRVMTRLPWQTRIFRILWEERNF